MRAHLLVLLLGATACSWGPRAAKLEIAKNGAGASALVTMGETQFHGEVLAVSDSGLLLLGDSALVFAHYQDIDRAEIPDAPGDMEFGGRQPPSAEDREQLRLASRYPQGVTADLLKRLLGAYHWTSVGVLHP